jgi:peptidoglycan hydrolase-like protein with peptidoglycan-binding domain
MLPIPFNNPTTYPGHSGVDFPQPLGTSIPASGSGVVTFSGWQNDRAGYATQVRYDGGPTVLYCHQPEYADRPAAGTRVVRGTHIGRVGSTGHSTGPHLHLEIMLGGGANTYAGVWRYFSVDMTVAGVDYPYSKVVQREQEWLRMARGEQIVPDGRKGPATTAAYKRYQTFLRAYGYTGAIDGDWGDGTQAAHARYYGERAAQIATPKPSRKSSKSAGQLTYADIQEALNRHGYGLAVDGVWGPKSKAALADFQGRNGLTVDRIVGPATWSKMNID